MLNLVVLRCQDIDVSKAFYETFGLTFVQEQHGKSPIHYACERDGFVLELYPPNKSGVTQNIMIGFSIPKLDDALSALSNLGYTPKSPPVDGHCTILDPDGNSVMLTHMI